MIAVYSLSLHYPRCLTFYFCLRTFGTAMQLSLYSLLCRGRILLKLEKMIVLRKIVMFHTKYPKIGASRSARRHFLECTPLTCNPASGPSLFVFSTLFHVFVLLYFTHAVQHHCELFKPLCYEPLTGLLHLFSYTRYISNITKLDKLSTLLLTFKAICRFIIDIQDGNDIFKLIP